jgi:hypothetical protein
MNSNRGGLTITAATVRQHVMIPLQIRPACTAGGKVPAPNEEMNDRERAVLCRVCTLLPNSSPSVSISQFVTFIFVCICSEGKACVLCGSRDTVKAAPGPASIFIEAETLVRISAQRCCSVFTQWQSRLGCAGRGPDNGGHSRLDTRLARSGHLYRH